MRKDAAEVAQLRAAGAAIDRVHARMGEFLKAGRTEAQVGADIAAAIVEEGHTAAAFVIVGSGPNGASPHHDVSDRVIESGDVVVVDIGGPLPSGYYSDCTRTYAVGAEPSARVQEAYAVLQDAQERAVAAVRPGVTAEQVDAAARAPAHRRRAWASGSCTAPATASASTCTRSPTSSGGNTLALEPGMAFSVEPGVYLDGDWGARIEDIVVVTADGCERLNTRPARPRRPLDVWVVDSTPVECGRSRETTRRSDLVGYAEYGYCASHSRYFWGLRLHLIATLHGLPVGFALTGAKADERHVLLSVLAADAALLRRAPRPGHDRGQELLRPRVRGHHRCGRSRAPAPSPQR